MVLPLIKRDSFDSMFNLPIRRLTYGCVEMYLKEYSHIVDGIGCTFVSQFTENPDCNKYKC